MHTIGLNIANSCSSLALCVFNSGSMKRLLFCKFTRPLYPRHNARYHIADHMSPQHWLCCCNRSTRHLFTVGQLITLFQRRVSEIKSQKLAFVIKQPTVISVLFYFNAGGAHCERLCNLVPLRYSQTVIQSRFFHLPLASIWLQTNAYMYQSTVTRCSAPACMWCFFIWQNLMRSGFGLVLYFLCIG